MLECSICVCVCKAHLSFYEQNFVLNIHFEMTKFMLCLCDYSDQYLAPEVLRKQPYDNTVDWWCLGSVLYEMLFGLVSFNFGPTVCIFYYYYHYHYSFFPLQIELFSFSK